MLGFLKILQKLIRLFLNIPIVNRIVWRFIPHVREHFASPKIEPFITKYDKDIKIWVSLSEHIESHIFWQGVQSADRGEVKLLNSILKPGHIFFDIGANIGVFTLLAAKRVGSGRVYAFEPSKLHLEKLYVNLKLNNFTNIIVNPFGLSNVSGNRDLYIPAGQGPLRNTGMASFYPVEADSKNYVLEKIFTMRLDDYVESNDINKIDAIKIDVEGAEMDILEGAKITLKRFRPIVMMEVNKIHLVCAGRTLKELMDFWKDLDYSIHIIQNNGGLVPVKEIDDFRESQNICCCYYGTNL